MTSLLDALLDAHAILEDHHLNCIYTQCKTCPKIFVMREARAKILSEWTKPREWRTDIEPLSES